MQGAVHVLRGELRGRGSSGASATWYGYSLYVRDEKQGRQHRITAAGRWENTELAEAAEIWNEGVGLGQEQWKILFRVAVRNVSGSCGSQTHCFKHQKVWQPLVCTFHYKVLLSSQCPLLLH